jgi:undecaprenyl pyrophosphate phosphatase UppP
MEFIGCCSIIRRGGGKMRIKQFLLGRKGLNTVEVVVILAVVLGIALIFRKEITSFVKELFDVIFNRDIPIDLDPTKAT